MYGLAPTPQQPTPTVGETFAPTNISGAPSREAGGAGKMQAEFKTPDIHIKAPTVQSLGEALQKLGAPKYKEAPPQPKAWKMKQGSQLQTALWGLLAALSPRGAAQVAQGYIGGKQAQYAQAMDAWKQAAGVVADENKQIGADWETQQRMAAVTARLKQEQEEAEAAARAKAEKDARDWYVETGNTDAMAKLGLPLPEGPFVSNADYRAAQMKSMEETAKNTAASRLQTEAETDEIIKSADLKIKELTAKVRNEQMKPVWEQKKIDLDKWKSQLAAQTSRLNAALSAQTQRRNADIQAQTSRVNNASDNATRIKIAGMPSRDGGAKPKATPEDKYYETLSIPSELPPNIRALTGQYWSKVPTVFTKDTKTGVLYSNPLSGDWPVFKSDMEALKLIAGAKKAGATWDATKAELSKRGLFHSTLMGKATPQDAIKNYKHVYDITPSWW